MTSKASPWPPSPHRSTNPSAARTEPDWRDLQDSLDQIIQPLVHAGWRVVTEPIRDGGDGEHAPSVAYDLERGEDVIEIEYLASQMLNLFRGPFGGEEDDASNEAVTVDLLETDPTEFFRRERLLF